jgi:hypothetical protein
VSVVDSHASTDEHRDGKRLGVDHVQRAPNAKLEHDGHRDAVVDQPMFGGRSRSARST